MSNEDSSSKKPLTPNQRDDRRLALDQAVRLNIGTYASREDVVKDAEAFHAFLGGDQ